MFWGCDRVAEPATSTPPGKKIRAGTELQGQGPTKGICLFLIWSRGLPAAELQKSGQLSYGHAPVEPAVSGPCPMLKTGGYAMLTSSRPRRRARAKGLRITHTATIVVARP